MSEENKVKPISPKEAKQKFTVPDFVIEAVNELLIKNSSSGRIVLKQEQIIKAIQAKHECHRNTIFDNKWLDFEDLYRREGWKVTYDKPGYNETYEAFFEFRS